ncbi:ABC transporter ATP-binding protein [Paracoccus pantotrophus]|uniref:ABC transporter ATP-binding protein n=1 Tax=Paracoccus pantotrophus TaxID=82367 RepID=UPI0008ED175E|nr:ABC transporter ATP-binding protein [Paracoccus pantotrophus]MDF3855669.1 ABC transporter ATP-binding protein [Paracoccus pantotrophus]SFO78937.1 iron complex transport system ATP-binding protein [Paracoccus pantotrophus]
MIRIQGLTVGYGRKPVIRGLDASFAPGRFTALVGPNGCGKSTLLKAVMGFLRPQAGRVTLDGVPMARIPRRALARRIAWLPQENHCPDYLTLGELVEMGGHARQGLFAGPDDRDRLLFREALRTVGLQDQAHLPVNALSGGQRQRAFIAMVLAQDTPVVLMDEPVNHLDVTYQYALLGLVRDLTRRHGRTVVSVLHDLNLALSFADEVVMMSGGEARASGPVAEVLNAANLREVFDLDAQVIRHEGRRICLPALPEPSA